MYIPERISQYQTMLSQTTDITLVTEAKVAAKQWSPSNGTTSKKSPLLLISSEDDASQWTSFAEDASQGGEAIAVWDLAPYTAVQTIWAIGEPVTVIAQGKASCETALHAARLGKGAVRALVLVDYGIEDGEQPPFNEPSCPIVLVRGRQSEVADHEQTVRARSAFGSKCKLVELENCADKAAESCPQDFAATVEWFLSDV